MASVYCNVSTEIGNALLGQENQNISVNYLDMGQLKDQIDSVHQQVLREYKMNDIAIGLINKGRELWVREDGSLTPLTNLDLTFFEWFYDLDR